MPINFFNKFSATQKKHQNMTGKVFGGSTFTAKGLTLSSTQARNAQGIATDDFALRSGMASEFVGLETQGTKLVPAMNEDQTLSQLGREDFFNTNENGQVLPQGLSVANNETINLHGAGFTLAFMHVPTGREVEFKAYLDQISDAYTTNWSQESVYGRMDQIATFQNTQRAIAVSWIVPAGSEMEAIHNMKNIQHLMQFMYPLYSDDGILLSAPLLRLKFANLIRDAKTGKGLLGYVNGFTVDPDQEAGYFAYSSGPMTNQTELYPKAIRLNCDFTVLHEHELGYRSLADGYVFGRSTEEIKKYPSDIRGVDFPYPAGAGHPDVEGVPFIPVSSNSHYDGDTALSGEERLATFKEALLIESSNPNTAKYRQRYNNAFKAYDERNPGRSDY